MKSILDACCGSRMFWFDKNDDRVLFMDIREGDFESGSGKDFRVRRVHPDIIGDFTDMPFEDDEFKLVVFDPPHLKCGANSFMAASYGRLDNEWRETLSNGFSECFRVLRPGGILVFKWNESQIPTKEVLKLTDQRPLFGHISGKAAKTHWICFMKEESCEI